MIRGSITLMSHRAIRSNHLLIRLFDLFRQNKVEDDGDKGRDSKPRLQNEFDGVEEPTEALVVAGVGEDVVEVVGHERGAVAEREPGRQDEAVASREGRAAAYDGDAGDGDGAEEERGHAAEDRARDGDEGRGELGEDAREDQEETETLSVPTAHTRPPFHSKTHQQQYPAVRFAQRVRAITPLFCAKVVMGVMVPSAARMPLIPSARTPPWMRVS